MLSSVLLTLLSPIGDPLKDVDFGTYEAGEKLIVVGLDGAQLDACSSTGRVRGLRADGDGFLSVRAAPGTVSRRKDKIENEQDLFLCEFAEGWVGVVYLKSADDAVDCGVSSPVPFIAAYRGPCRYGWVSQRYVERIAG